MSNQDFVQWTASIAALRPAQKEFLDAHREAAAAVLGRNRGLASPDIIETLDKLIKMPGRRRQRGT